MTKKTVKRKTNSKTKTEVAAKSNSSYLSKIESEVQANQSRLSMVLGALILLVLGILIFNYFNKSKSSLGPAQQTQMQQDVASDKLPGKYTVKEGDTLFLISQKYYNDGDKYTEIAKANNLTDPNTIEKDQVLEIPKLADSGSVIALPTPSQTPEMTQPTDQAQLGTGGGNTTMWGSKIDGTSYTVQEGDWLSTIAARAYGDINSYEKLAKANNLQNADYIYPGQVLTIPR